MRAVDTNVLVRLVARDDAKQVAVAEAFVVRGAWVPHLVLAEATWVLTSVYDRRPKEIATAHNLRMGKVAAKVAELRAEIRATRTLADEAKKLWHSPLSLAVGVVDVDLNEDIRVYDLERNSLTRRLTSFGGRDFSPVWTPDGRRIYYVSVGVAGLSWRDVDGVGEG